MEIYLKIVMFYQILNIIGSNQLEKISDEKSASIEVENSSHEYLTERTEKSENKVKLPPIKDNEKPLNNLKQSNDKSSSSQQKKTKEWVKNMPPMLGHNIKEKETSDLLKFDEKKFWVYAVFREKIFDKILREEMKKIAVQAIEKAKYK